MSNAYPKQTDIDLSSFLIKCESIISQLKDTIHKLEGMKDVWK